MVFVNKNKIRFKIYTLGCKVNQYDSMVLGNLLSLGGNFILSNSKKSTDLIVINSCSVTKSAITKSRRFINSSKKNYPKAKIVLIGCWPKIYKIDNLSVDFIFNSRDQKKILKDINNIFIKEINKSTLKKKEQVSCFLGSIDNRSRYFIKVQDGCQQFCSYCVIPLARGPLKSRLASDILLEIKQAAENGFEEFVLSGIHLGLYGKDFKNSQLSLYSLLLKIVRIKKVKRIRLSSIEVNEVNNSIINLIAENKKMCRHLHIPVQSGSDKILKLMNRPYDGKYFYEKIEKIRKKIPDIAITTDVIVGFPGENNNDFKESYIFFKKINFSKIHVFSFSAHEKTPAYNFSNKVEASIIKDRSRQLRDLSREMENSYRNYILKKYKEIEVLIEGFSNKKIRAKTEFYFDIFLDINKLKKAFSSCDIDDFSLNKLLGRLLLYKLK